MKFTDEELSRILSAHEGGQLFPFGCTWGDCGDPRHANGAACVVQAAKLIADNGEARVAHYSAVRFDCEYDRAWTAVRFLRWLEAQGVA